MATLTENWRDTLLDMADELSALTGKSTCAISKEYAGNSKFYDNLKAGNADILTDRNLRIHEALRKEVKKARRAGR